MSTLWRSRGQLIVRIFSLVVLSHVVWFALLVVFFLGSLLTLVVGGSGGGWGLSAGLPVSFNLAPNSYELQLGESSTKLRGVQASLFSGEESSLWPVWFLSALAGLAFSAFYLFVLFRTWHMANGIVDGKPFARAHVQTLKWVGGLLVAFYALQKVRWLLGRYVWAHVEVSGSVLPPDLTFQYRSDYAAFVSELLFANMEFLLAGVGVWLIAEVFAYGIRLQAERDTLQLEQDLTI